MIGTGVQEDHLWIADPKAINHILQKSGYLYAKPSNTREQVALLADRDGIASAEGRLPIRIGFSNLSNDPEGNAHKRHRRVIAPAFGLVETKGFVPYFTDAAAKARGLLSCLLLKADLGPCRQMADKWSDIITRGESGCSAVIDVNMWFGKATLDV